MSSFSKGKNVDGDSAKKIHRIRTTLTSRNGKNLEKVCADQRSAVVRHTEALTTECPKLPLADVVVKATARAEGEAKSRFEAQSKNGKANGLLTEEDHLNNSVARHTKALMSKMCN